MKTIWTGNLPCEGWKAVKQRGREREREIVKLSGLFTCLFAHLVPVIPRKVNVNWIFVAVYACALCLENVCNEYLECVLHKTLFVTIDTHLQLHLHALHHFSKHNSMHDIACEMPTFPWIKSIDSIEYVSCDVCTSSERMSRENKNDMKPHAYECESNFQELWNFSHDFRIVSVHLVGCVDSKLLRSTKKCISVIRLLIHTKVYV